jgi:N-acetylglucosaminyldiphosphoundecaprenol N-acetyl-beta-D-mannosaminyltransferase
VKQENTSSEKEMATRSGTTVLSTFIDALSWSEVLARVHSWAAAGESRYVCVCNVHSVATARGCAKVAGAINDADMAIPDGMPIAWTLRRLGFDAQPRIPGPELMERLCDTAARVGTPIFLYGSTDPVLERLRKNLSARFPGLAIVGAHSPPFHPMSAKEDADVVLEMTRSGAQIVFVGLGCPKQEMWMSEHRGKVNAVMIGVGAAFDFHAGTAPRAPAWMQNIGLEWLHRLCSEPGRLWRRYLVTNTVFVYEIARHLLRTWKDRGTGSRGSMRDLH